MSRVTAHSGRPFFAASAVVVFLAMMPLGAAAESRPAVVEGTTQLFIRRGPGTEFPPFATLTGGSQVQVEETHGAWARVTTASGQVGYVHARFLKMARAAETAPPPTSESATVQPTRWMSPTGAAPTEIRTSTATEVEEQTTPVIEPTATPVELPLEPQVRGSAGPPVSLPDEQAEIRRLADAVEALGRRFDQRLPLPNGAGSTMIEPTTGVSGGAVLLGLLGVIVGWLLGATYQRNKERGRRSRIRL
jgi:uncharacterized protein YgiM (DUF1202 family)